MDSHEAGLLLQQCVEAAEKQRDDKEQQNPTEEQTRAYHNCRDVLCAELSSLLQEAEHMQWPFVPERWQYKQSVEAQDKTNLSDLIQEHLHTLLVLLKVSIQCQEAVCALAVVFLVDRFLYWTDESRRLLKITKLLHKLHPEAPVAPQLVIRQARLYLNSGKLQKAEYILSGLINNSGTTGCWLYPSNSERALVQAVSVQVRGMILQKLGLWLEAAELIWASLVGYYALPKPDKKGIGTSLGLLANILVSMNDEDFSAFKTNPDVDLSLLGESSHHLLSAAQAAKMAVVYSQYTSLYVLTNVVSQGTSLLTYSFSIHCPSSLRRSYLLQAREAFEIGLLTKSSSETVSSIQELHTFLKAAYSLATTQKWLGAKPTIVAQAKQACKEALGFFYNYCNAQNQIKDALCSDITRLIGKVKDLLQVLPFANSDKQSFIPDSYRDIKETPVDFDLEKFSKMILKFKKFHATLCEMDRTCKSANGDQAKFCITALGTTIGTVNPECSAQANVPAASRSSSDGLGSSWNKISFSNSPRFSSGSPTAAKIQSLPTTETDDDKMPSSFCGGNLAKSATSTNNSPHSWNFHMIQAALETLDTESENEKAIVSLSDSCGSNSSWEKLSANVNVPRNKPMLAKIGSKSSESSEGLFHLDTLDSETPEFLQVSSNNGNPSTVNGNAPVVPIPNSIQANQCASTETSTDSSFEMLEQVKMEDQADETSKTEQTNDPKEEKNDLCHNCLNESFAKSSKGQDNLTEQDYNALLAGVCHQCLLQRLNSGTRFQLKEHKMAYSGLHLKFSKTTGLWTAWETCVYIGADMKLKGKQRSALWVQFLHQEERLSSYVGKDYLKPRQMELHLKDVERQMTAQFYVTQFNKSLYERELMAQIFFIPSEALLILEENQIVGCVTVEPYMLGDFVKLTNNTVKKEQRFEATEYGIAFGHFTYLISGGQEVVVDLQGWVTANGKGLTYLTDPQIHSTKTPKGPSNPFAERGLRYFLEEQHGPRCNEICSVLQLPPVPRLSPLTPHSL
ncbi:alpha-protein kinase 1 [Eucyclogobius newberryi]|uniref:alpha-protein kinase 1 n=1 Tax=Eucyclogobius newberryi TaxID=166745 RepID=UPI003B5C3F25